MVICAFCGGLGTVAAGGITSQFAGVFGMDVRPCGRCHGSGLADPADYRVLPTQRTGTTRPDLAAVLPGDWLVEIHGSGRILALIRFVLTTGDPVQHFEASCEYGGLPEWRARGEWTVGKPGNALRFAGTQSSPVLLTAGYRWGVTLESLDQGLLRGQSISDELTVWSRKLDARAGHELDPGVRRVGPAVPGPARG